MSGAPFRKTCPLVDPSPLLDITSNRAFFPLPKFLCIKYCSFFYIGFFIPFDPRIAITSPLWTVRLTPFNTNAELLPPPMQLPVSTYEFKIFITPKLKSCIDNEPQLYDIYYALQAHSHFQSF